MPAASADLVGRARELGARYAGERVSFKPWPSCRATHPFVEGALALRAEQGLSVRIEIAGVRLVGSPSARARGRAARAEASAGHRRRGEVQRLLHRGARARRPAASALGSFAPGQGSVPAELLGARRADRFVRVDEPSVSTAGRVEVDDDDGRMLACEVPVPLGAPGNPTLRRSSCSRSTSTARATPPRPSNRRPGKSSRSGFSPSTRRPTCYRFSPHSPKGPTTAETVTKLVQTRRRSSP